MSGAKKIIAIIGLMGVGKTTIGNKLAQKMGCYFIDCDQEIEDREGKSISEIFAQNGENYFRDAEKKLIAEVVTRDEEIVLSLGGGAFVSEEVQKILRENAVVIWFFAEVSAILQRVGHKNNRPLLQNKNKREVLEQLAEKRYPIYAKADLKFDTTNENHEVLIRKIIKQIQELRNAK